jgi:hypothetical protein
MMTAEQILQKYGSGQNTATPSGSPGSMSSGQVLQRFGGQPSSTPASSKDTQWQDALSAAADFAKGAAKGAGSTIFNVGRLGESILSNTVGRGVDFLTGKPRLDNTKADQFIGQSLTPTNTAQKLGFGAEQIAEFFIPGGAVTKAGKALQSTKAISQLGSLGKAGAKLVPQIAADIGVAGAQSGGDVKTMRDAGLFSLGGGVVGGVAARGLKNFGNFLFLRSVPGTSKQLANDLKKGLDIGEALSKTGVSFTKGQLLGKVANKINVLTNKVDDAVGAVGSNLSRSFDEVADDTIKLFNDKEIASALEATPINLNEIKTIVTDTVNKYRQLYAGKMLSPAEQHQLKQDIGVGLGRAWDKMLSTPIRAEAFTESKIYGALNDFLRKNVDGYEALNKQIAPLREATKRAGEKAAYSGYLTDVIAATFAGGNPQQIFEDPVSYFKGAATGVLLKRGLTSTAAKTIGGTIAKNIGAIVDTPAFYQLIRQIISSPQATPGSQQTMPR